MEMPRIAGRASNNIASITGISGSDDSSKTEALRRKNGRHGNAVLRRVVRA